ncbi:MAG: hypothetical protein Q7V57_00455 [Actinomycetota bacterium]|nr:hypothetical protein [Actinomycetota bacterium]
MLLYSVASPLWAETGTIGVSIAGASAAALLALTYRRPRIALDSGDLIVHVYWSAFTRRIPLEQIEAFELCGQCELPRCTPNGMYAVRARLCNGSFVQIDESESLFRSRAERWLTWLQSATGKTGQQWTVRPVRHVHLDRDALAANPLESIRTVHRGVMHDLLVRATVVEGGFSAITSRLDDGTVVRSGPSRPTLDLAIDDAVGEIRRLAARPDGQ